MKANATSAFAVHGVRYDLFQARTITTQAATRRPIGTTPYPLEITARFPQVSLPEDNPLTEEGVALGRMLFHDPLLSSSNTQSCASCHTPKNAFADDKPFSIGAQGQLGERNAMPLFNLAWGEEFFWDGRAKSLREQVLQPIQDAHEMNERLDRVLARLASTPAYPTAFAKAFGQSELTSEKLALALEQFLLTLVSQNSRFDLAVRKLATLSDEEKRGLQLFVTEYDPARQLRGADCFHCHGGTLFSDYQFHDNGLDLAEHDIGRMAATGLPSDRGKFKTPSLRNIAVTAPYMHDGRFATLEEVVDHYDCGVKRNANLDPNLAKHPISGLQLSGTDKRALVAFLKTLTDEAFTGPSPELTPLASSHPLPNPEP
jgi:cytochrome c peroxidase